VRNAFDIKVAGASSCAKLLSHMHTASTKFH